MDALSEQENSHSPVAADELEIFEPWGSDEDGDGDYRLRSDRCPPTVSDDSEHEPVLYEHDYPRGSRRHRCYDYDYTTQSSSGSDSDDGGLHSWEEKEFATAIPAPSELQKSASDEWEQFVGPKYPYFRKTKEDIFGDIVYHLKDEKGALRALSLTLWGLYFHVKRWLWRKIRLSQVNLLRTINLVILLLRREDLANCVQVIVFGRERRLYEWDRDLEGLTEESSQSHIEGFTDRQLLEIRLVKLVAPHIKNVTKIRVADGCVHILALEAIIQQSGGVEVLHFGGRQVEPMSLASDRLESLDHPYIAATANSKFGPLPEGRKRLRIANFHNCVSWGPDAGVMDGFRPWNAYFFDVFKAEFNLQYLTSLDLSWTNIDDEQVLLSILRRRPPLLHLAVGTHPLYIARNDDYASINITSALSEYCPNIRTLILCIAAVEADSKAFVSGLPSILPQSLRFLSITAPENCKTDASKAQTIVYHPTPNSIPIESYEFNLPFHTPQLLLEIAAFGEHLVRLVLPNLMYVEMCDPETGETLENNSDVVLRTIARWCVNWEVVLLDYRMGGQGARGLRAVLEGCPKVRIGWVPIRPVGVPEEVLDGLRGMGRLIESGEEGFGICQRLADVPIRWRK
ncbi:hypothetical protein HDV00_006983 [Rhizophlyctis rosea]|nr:hypothetical protein HDV00_006983 [Rhizophlyctis rosea]